MFPDGRSLTDRLAEIQNALDPPGATPRVKPLPGGVGLDRILAELDSEASEADDFVDTHFTRAQVNLYRIRKLMLGQTAAQKLLVNPAIAAIAEQETATASADQLGAFIAAAKVKKVPAADVTAALAPRPSRVRLVTSASSSSRLRRFNRSTPFCSSRRNRSSR